MDRFFDGGFVGREEELADLQNRYDGGAFEFAVIYGRRRVGKSSLIKEFLRKVMKDGSTHIDFTSIEQNDALNLRSFSEIVLERFPEASIYLAGFSDWDRLFSYVAAQSGVHRLVLSIDEYPYLAASNPSITSILQKHIDSDFRNTGIFLILTGSSMTFMENQILGYQSPLYGRRTSQYRIRPFDFFDAVKMLPPTWSPVDSLAAYGATGGVPLYLSAFAKSSSFTDAVIANYLKPHGGLYEEPSNLLKQELRDPAVYNSIITAIAHGATKLHEIADKVGENDNKVAKYISVLISLEILRRESPYGKAEARRGIYRVQDNMYRFWHRFVAPNVMNIENGLFRQTFESKVEPYLSEYLGPVFEDVCIQYLNRMNALGYLPFLVQDIGRWWGTDPSSRISEEIDIVAGGAESLLLAECKWQSAPINVGDFEKLKRRAALVSTTVKDPHFYLFSRSGFTDALVLLKNQLPNLHLISYDDVRNLHRPI